MSGRGLKHMANGDVYDGEWRDDKADGWGIKMFANGDRHEGEVSGGDGLPLPLARTRTTVQPPSWMFTKYLIYMQR